MQCKVTVLPIPTITWRKAFSHLPKGKIAVVDGNLTIRNVAKADSGDYACSAKNLLGKDFVVAQLTVIGKLKFTFTPPLKSTVSESSNLLFDCAAKGTQRSRGRELETFYLTITLLIPMELCFSGT